VLTEEAVSILSVGIHVARSKTYKSMIMLKNFHAAGMPRNRGFAALWALGLPERRAGLAARGKRAGRRRSCRRAFRGPGFLPKQQAARQLMRSLRATDESSCWVRSGASGKEGGRW